MIHDDPHRWGAWPPVNPRAARPRFVRWALRISVGTLVAFGLWALTGCGSTRQEHVEIINDAVIRLPAFVVATPVGPIEAPPLDIKVHHRGRTDATGETHTAPDPTVVAPIAQAASGLFPGTGGLLSLVLGLVTTVWGVHKGQQAGGPLKAIVRGLESAKAAMPADAVALLHQHLSGSLDESHKDKIRTIKATQAARTLKAKI